MIGPLMMIQKFAPVLARNGGGALLNVLSALTWISVPGGPATYSATKAALWSLTNSPAKRAAIPGDDGVGAACRIHGHGHG